MYLNLHKQDHAPVIIAPRAIDKLISIASNYNDSQTRVFIKDWCSVDVIECKEAIEERITKFAL